jgi:hypothetical protein
VLGVLDIDLGPGLVFFLLVFIAIPIALAALATAAIMRLTRNRTRRLAVGIYVMLVCAAVAPAPILWGDDHLGFTSSQAFEGYGALFWAVGTFLTMQSLSGVMQRRQLVLVPFGLVVGAIVLSGLAVGGVGAGVGLSLIPVAGSVEVLLAFGWLTHRGAGAALPMNWRLATAAGTLCAFAVAASVYLGGPQAFGSQASVMDFALLVVVAWLPIVVFAGSRIFAARPPAASSKSD